MSKNYFYYLYEFELINSINTRLYNVKISR